jgi:hypothetical protein
VKFRLVLTLIFSLIGGAAYASTPAKSIVKMIGLKPSSMIELSTDPNDQIISVQASASTISVVGTMHGDGFINGYERTGSLLNWSLKLGGANDDIATASFQDTLGNIWIAGASAVAADPITPKPIPTGVLNPSGVMPDTSTALPALRQLDIWKVSPKGILVNNWSTLFKAAIYPSSISVKAGKATVSGSIATQPSDHFSISTSVDGTFLPPKYFSQKVEQIPTALQVKTSLSLWKAFTTSTAIKGLSSWKAKANSHVLIRYDLKSKAVLGAYITSGEIQSLGWEKSIGVVALISYPSGYGIAVVK